MRIHDLPTHSRPREKMLERGVSALTDAELLAVVLRTGYKGQSVVKVSERILKRYPLSKLLDLKINELTKIKGIGTSHAASLTAIREISCRINKSNPSVSIRNVSDVVNLCAEIRDKKKEYFILICLNARNEIITKEIISIGSLTTGLVHPREVFLPAITNHAARIIVIHNHPSNDPSPSQEDLQITKRLSQAGELLGITLIDHVIVAKTDYCSLNETKQLR